MGPQRMGDGSEKKNKKRVMMENRFRMENLLEAIS